jgi:hypothetical protein
MMQSAISAVSRFAKRHLWYTVAIVAAVAIVVPLIMTACGFGASGPIHGKYSENRIKICPLNMIGSSAAAWQSAQGNLASGSLFSFFQPLGMINSMLL